MRIAIFTDTYYPDINGVVSSIGILRNELMKHGHQVLIITTIPPHGVQMNDDSSIIRMNGISLKSIYGYRVAGIYNNKIFKQIKEFNPDIIHTQTEYGVGLFGRLCGYKLNVPTVYTFHTNLYDYTYYVTKGLQPLDAIAKIIVKKLMKVYTTHTTSLIVPSDKTASMMKSIGINKEINIVPTGLELERFKIHNEDHTKQIKEKYSLTNHFNLISLGRLAEEKSLDFIISAMPEIIKRNPDIRLFIIGDGPAKETLTQLTNDLKMDEYIRFAGCQSADVIPDFYYSGDLFVSASLTETQGLTFIEAMASSLPVLARYDSNLDPVIVEGKNGHFFYSKEEYVDKVIELSHKDLTPYKQHAVKHAQQFDSHTFYEGVMQVYDTSIDHFENCFMVSSLTPHEKMVSIEFNSGKRKVTLECSLDDVESFHLVRGARINQDVIDILKEKQDVRQLYFKAIKLLSYHDYCFHDLVKRLETYGEYNEIEIMKCMALLTDRHLVDDRKYVKNYIEATLKKGKGFKKAIIDLKNKDIPEYLIEEEIAKFDETEEKDYALNIVDQLYHTNSKLSPQGLIQKIKRTLFNKGFSQSTIESVMNTYDFEFSHERTLSLLKKECEKTYKRYQNKYHGQELKMRISRFLKQKGYDYEDILIVMDEIWSEMND
ncbi:RecX family transcriptional regulator [uncultured Catenibacterium sp.]|uniref:glycosyltransferase n=1 Tax=uncultured Catenibacterium sp. TaxID=286142 RepID=UPI0025CCB3A1|nr:RecX family transcriptional regulator [uncultured Catenibacterium sp.]